MAVKSSTRTPFNIGRVRLSLAMLLLCCFAIPNYLFAQLSALHSYKRAGNVIVMDETADTLLYAFAGGMNSSQFMNIDLDLDGTFDLLVFDRHGNRLLPFLIKPGKEFEYSFAPGLADELPKTEQWIQTHDYNQDGRMDIFTYTTGGIKVFRNDSQGSLKFTQVSKPFLLSQQGATLTNILVTSVDYPAITDIDADGDLDVLCFWGLGSFIEWHRNTSIERFGTTDSLTFEKASSCWGHFAEGNEDNTIKLDTCSGSDKTELTDIASNDPKHTGSTILVHDHNADGLPDITLGDVDFNTLVHLTNGGTIQNAEMISQTVDFPEKNNAVNLNSFPAAMLADVNNDKVNDLLVSPFDPSLIKGRSSESNLLYLNTGTNENPDFSFLSNSFLQNQMLDFGSGSYPVLFDYNADGLLDVLVGNYGYSDTCIFTPETGLQCTFTSKLALLLNIGTPAQPAFQIAERNIAKLDLLQMQSLIPAIGDMDADGDQDLVCGNSKGKLVYCENIATAGQNADFVVKETAWLGIDAGDFSAPQLTDIDGDGLIDLVVGKRNGTMNYYRNSGTAQLPQFALVSEKLGNVDVTDTLLTNNGYNVPFFYTDKSGERFLFAGSEFGDIYVYNNVHGIPNETYNLLGVLPSVHEGWRSSVALGNLNNDTLTDLFTGNYAGGPALYFGKPDQIFGVNYTENHNITDLILLPNPARNEVIIQLSEKAILRAGTITIRNIEGQILKSVVAHSFPVQIELSDLKNGVYLVSFQNSSIFSSTRLVVCK